jgi:hypothetical protein
MLKAVQLIAAASAIIFLLSLATISYLSSPPSGYPSEQQSTTESKAKQQAKEQHSLRGFVRFMFPDAISIFTFWLVLATVALGIVAVVQIGLLNRAERIATESANAAKESAEATKSAVNLSDRRTELQLRAYVFPDVQRVINISVGQKPIIQILFRNTGRTPAYHLTSWYGADLRMYPNTGPFAPPPDDTKQQMSQRFVGPGGFFSMEKPLDVPITAEQLQGLANGTLALYFWGELNYTDEFSKPRFTKFRSFYGGAAGARADGATAGAPEGNEAQ